MDSTNSSSSPAADATREATAQAANVASTAAEQTTAVASTAVEGGKWVAAVGHEEAREITATATDQVAHVANEVSAQARNLVDESKNQLRSQAQTQTDQIATKLREIGGQVQALAEGRTDEAGAVGDYARQAAQTVSQFAGRIEQRGFDGIVDDVQRFARRKPGTFLLGAALAGFGIGRVLRSGAMSQPSQPQGVGSPQQLQQLASDAAAYAPYDALGMTTQPPLVDVTDGTVGAMSTTDDTARLAPTDGTIADETLGTTVPSGASTSPMSAPTDPSRIR